METSAPAHWITDPAAAIDTERCTVQSGARLLCYHCGTPCTGVAFRRQEKDFCCQGCATVYELLQENGLGHFYRLGPQSGIRVTGSTAEDRFRYLDEPAVREQLLDFADATRSKVTFQIPAIHCVACVWLLENLFRLHPAIGQSQVNFPKRELAVTFRTGQMTLSALVALLSRIGYEPEFRLANLEARPVNTAWSRLWLQVGLAGFAFGNIMLFSFPAYLGFESGAAPGMKGLFGALALALALPVLVYSALDYWRAAWLCLRERMITIDLPIAAGLVALFGQSAFEIISGRGEGYLDSMTGLIFFLLCGRIFQQKSYDRLLFDRDYKSFFPLAVTRREPAGERSVSLAAIAVGDRVVLRHGELIPADARLVSGQAVIDYSFVTGESTPVEKQPGDYLYAGGQQTGSVIEIEILKPVSQSYLTSLWAHDTFAKARPATLATLTDQFSRRFTVLVATIAVGAGIFWAFSDPSRAVKSFTSVLIVACPCALALAAPFALGTAQRLLARHQVFLKNATVLETVATVNTVTFDKTGTLTTPAAAEVLFNRYMPGPDGTSGSGEALDEETARCVAALARQSTHPLARRIYQSCARGQALPEPAAFRETPGCGIEARVAGHEVLLGSRSWLISRGLSVPDPAGVGGTTIHLGMDGAYRGLFRVLGRLPAGIAAMLRELGRHCALALVSGDNAADREHFRALFPPQARLLFNQEPLDKLECVREFQQAGRRVMMVGDGLNDAGALKQSEVGLAVVENMGAFCPASDIMIETRWVPHLPRLLRCAQGTVRIVRLSFLLSSLYNAVGITIAAQGLLSPLVCAILMPLSSVSVVGFASLGTRWMCRRAGLELRPQGLASEAQPISG